MGNLPPISAHLVNASENMPDACPVTMNTNPSHHSGLECLWADHSDSTVSMMTIVVQLNILEHISLHGFPGLKSFAVNHLGFETVKEARDTGIVIAISLGIHATLGIVSGQQRLTGELSNTGYRAQVDYQLFQHLSTP